MTRCTSRSEMAGSSRQYLLFGFLCLSIQIHLTLAMAIKKPQPKNAIVEMQRSRRSMQEPGKIGCIHMESFSGHYWYESTGGSTVCGLFLIGLPDQIIEVEFTDFTIACEGGGLLATLDGWETQGQMFPTEEDHLLSMDERYQTYCGHNNPSSIFITSQNVGLIQFRIPVKGQGFNVNVRFISNPTPCNMVSMEPDGMYTLRNYGLKRNCTASFLYPESFKILSLDVGETPESTQLARETGTLVKCGKRGRGGDVLQIMGGEGLDTTLMTQAVDVCGLDSTPDLPTVSIGCTHSVIRLVSSGNYYNSVTFQYSLLTPENLASDTPMTQCYTE